jgi:hypothetical protein
VIVHTVWFRPRPGLSPEQRGGLAAALSSALREIPSIRRARVGRRITIGRPYEQLMRVDYTHAAVLEFDDVAGLRAYLDHSAHADLAARFFEAFEEALMYDFELLELQDGIDLLLDDIR